MSDPQAGYGTALVRRRRLVLIGWLLLIGALGLFAGKANTSLRAGGFDVPGSQSAAVNQILNSQFHTSDENNVAVVYHVGSGTLVDPAYVRKAQAAEHKLQKLPGVLEVHSFFIQADPSLLSTDMRTAVSVVTLAGSDADAQNKVPDIRASLKDSGLNPKVGGFPALQNDTYQISKDDLKKTEKVTFPIVTLFLLLFFGTAVAAAIPLLLGISAIVAATGLLGLLGEAFSISYFSLNIGSLVGLGLSIDFSLILVRRYREERAGGRAPHDAVARTMATSGRSILFSGLTLLVSMVAVSLIFHDLMIVRSISIGVLTVGAFGLLGALTFTPALLAVLGDKVERLRVIPRRTARPDGDGTWYRLSHSVMRRPVVWLTSALVVIGLLALPLLNIRFIGANTGALPASTESVVAQKQMESAFAKNALTPISITIKNPKGQDSAFTNNFLATLRTTTNTIAADPRTNQVDSLSTLLGAVHDDRFPLIRRKFFSPAPEMTDAGVPANLPGISIDPIIDVPVGGLGPTVAAPAWGGLGTINLPAGFHQAAVTTQAFSALRITSGSLTATVGQGGVYVPAAEPNAQIQTTGLPITLNAGDVLAVKPNATAAFSTAGAPVSLTLATVFEVRNAEGTQTSWLQGGGAPNVDLFPGVPRTVLSGGMIESLPTGPAVMDLDYIVVQPGTFVPQHIHPGPEIIDDLSGSLVVHKSPPQEMTVTDPNGTSRDNVPFDTPLPLSPGGHAIVQMGQVHWAVTAGSDPAVVYSMKIMTADLPPASLVGPQQEAAKMMNLNGKADTAVITVLPKADPYSPEYQNYVTDLRDRILPSISGLSAYQVSVGGIPANFVDFKHALYGRFPLLALVIGLLIFIMLALFFRSVLLPLAAAVTSVLPLIASYGVLVWLFQYGHGQGALGFTSQGMLNVVTPIIVFVILFGLSADYEVFMLSRVREEYEAGGDNEQSVARGVQRTAGVITAAALVLIATFGSLAVSGLETLKEIGVGLAVGVFVDATIVRLVVVPATMRLFGRANWYLPPRLGRILPRIDHGGAAPAEAIAPEPELETSRGM